MHTLRPRIVITLGLLFGTPVALAQNAPAFDIAAYQAFLSAHVDMTSGQLMGLHPAGVFALRAPVIPDQLAYFHTMDSCYSFTPYERSLLADHGFVVTDRLASRTLRGQSFGSAFLEIYNHDLPVFVSVDAILHAIHSSYDMILRDTEQAMLIVELDSLIAGLRGQISAMSGAYISQPAMNVMLRDLDVYLTVASALLGDSAVPFFPENAASVGELQVLIKNQSPAFYNLFSSNQRMIDFSQFIIRGHYTQSVALGRYFQAMMWLGRTEMYLLPPEGMTSGQTPADIQRQTIDAALLVEALDRAGAFPLLGEIDGLIRMFVGESDNVSLPQMKTLLQRGGSASPDQLLSSASLAAFQDTLRSEPFAFQRINSQILFSADPLKPGSIKPASSVLLLGQRFVVDSYVTGNVVYDKISYQGLAVWRALPSALDVLFALGNDAAAQLLTQQLDTYHYASNLAAMRYLIDGYDETFWSSSLYNSWLGMIRACNPPADRSHLPQFMSTGAWWQEKMNTQLASWAELRHDNLLYAKQSYTGSPGCSFPKSYVEPLPAFFDAAGAFARVGREKLVPLLTGRYYAGGLTSFFSRLASASDTLGSIASKELAGTSLSAGEIQFLQHMAYMVPAGCTQNPDGWYYQLYYDPAQFYLPNYVVADVHTCPADQWGNMVGWVWHVGTGPISTAVVSAAMADAGPTAYIGPVSSYRENVTTNFLRLTDDQWSTSYALTQLSRPSFVNAYLADSSGNSRGAGESLLTGVPPERPAGVPLAAELFQNYPNPFNPTTNIRYVLPHRSDVTMAVYNTLGQLVATLVRTVQEGGYHDAKFDGTGLASGVYFYRLQAGDFVQTKGLLLLK